MDCYYENGNLRFAGRDFGTLDRQQNCNLWWHLIENAFDAAGQSMEPDVVASFGRDGTGWEIDTASRRTEIVAAGQESVAYDVGTDYTGQNNVVDAVAARERRYYENRTSSF